MGKSNNESLASAMPLTRRGFVKAAAAAGVAGAVGSGMFATDSWLAPQEAFADEPEERIAYTFHQNHCFGHCSLKCTVRDGRLCLIEPNDAEVYASRYRTVCAKGLSEIQHVYSADRVQTPLRRIEGAARGEGKFEAISWDEALAIISENIQKVWDAYGHNAVAILGSTDAALQYPHLQKVWGAQGRGQSGLDCAVAAGIDPAVGPSGGWGYVPSETRNWVGCRTLLNVSANYLETSMASAKTFFEAQEAGCHIITIDPQFTSTASKSDEWVPIEPGTDPALALGMITCVLDNGWVDEEFVTYKTSFPFLVDPATGSMLREHEGADATTKGADNPFMVWDATTDSLKPYNADGVEPQLQGGHEIDGVEYVTVYDLLLKNQQDYTVEWASAKSTVSVETIERITREYACNKPSTLAVGWGGSDKYLNADIGGHAWAVLAALTGNLGQRHNGIGIYLGSGYGVGSHTTGQLAAWKLPEGVAAAKQECPSYNFRVKENSVRAAVALGDCLQQQYANFKVTTDWIASLDFVVGIEMYHSTSMNWCDIVLPATTKFEANNPIEGVKAKYGHILARGKVLDPLFEAKTDLEIEKALCECMGLKGIVPENGYEFAKYQVANATHELVKGMTLADLEANQNVMPMKGIETPRFDYDWRVAQTLSGRVDVYYEKMLPYGQQLPVYEEPVEAYADNPLREKYPLQFAQGRTKYYLHSMFRDGTWLQQYNQPVVSMNPVDMAPRGLATGDTIEVFNDRGSFKCTVVETEAVRPGTAHMIEGAWQKHIAEGNYQNVTNDEMTPRSPAMQVGGAIPYQDTLVEVRKA